jgi:tape measure domain-containing protein
MPISLGDITFGIGPDTTRLRQSIGDITNFGRAVEGAAQATQGAATGATAALLRQEQAAISALQKVQRFQDQVARSAATPQLQNQFNNLSTQGLDTFIQRMTSGQMTAIQFQREMERLGVTMGNAQRIFKNWEASQAAQARAERAAAQQTAAAARAARAAQMAQGEMALVENLRKLSAASILVAGPLSGIATRISVVTTLAEHFSLATAGMVVGIAGAAFAFFKLSTAIVNVARDLSTITSTMDAVTGSQAIAATQIKYLSDFADRAGVKFQDLAKNYGQITAAAKGTSLEGERVNKVFEAVTLAAGKLGLSTEDVKGSLLAVQQMITKGTVQMEELKSQLGDRLPGALKIYADALGVSQQKFSEMVKKGEVGASTLTKFAEKLRERYGINEDAKIDTITAAENRLANARTRMLDTLDKALGISSAYTNTLDKISQGLNWVNDNSQKTIIVVGQVGVALLTAFAAPMLLNGIVSITVGIGRLTSGIWALNAATAAGAFTSFVKLLATASIAIAAYYGSEKLLQGALAKTNESYLSALPAVSQYIDAQKNLVSSVRKPTLDYIASQEEMLKQAEAQRAKLVESATALLGWGDVLEKTGMSAEKVASQLKNMGFSDSLGSDIEASDKKIATIKKNIVELNDILKRQTEAENKERKDPKKEEDNKQTLAIKNAQDTVRELNATYANLFKAPRDKEWSEAQNRINKDIENFRDQLTRTEMPAAKVTELTNKYAASLRKVREAEITLSRQTSYFQAIEGIFSRGFDKGIDAFVSMVVEGKNALDALRDVAKSVASDILKTFMQLAVANPIKNALFGTNYNSLGGGGGIGGILGGGFGQGFFGGGGYAGVTGSVNVGSYAMPTIGFANGGIMTPNGRKPLRSYAGGGIANSAQFAEFGEGRKPEAFVPLPDGRSIPVTMQGAQGQMPIHIHEAPGVKADVSYGNKNGDPGIHVMLKAIARQALMEDITSGGGASRQMEKQYGLRRTSGLGG